PCDAVGVSPPHPTALAIRIGGTRYCCSEGNAGLAPICFLGSPPLSSQLASARLAAATDRAARPCASFLGRGFVRPCIMIILQHVGDLTGPFRPRPSTGER